MDEQNKQAESKEEQQDAPDEPQEQEKPMTKEEIEEMLQKKKKLKRECLTSSVTLGVLLLVIFCANIYDTYFKFYLEPEEFEKKSQWTSFSDSEYIQDLFDKSSISKSDSIEDANILWVSDAKKLAEIQAQNQTSKKVYNSYGNELTSKYYLLKYLNSFDLTEKYTKITHRKFLSRHFSIPVITDYDSQEDYIELTQHKVYNSSNTFTCWVEDIVTTEVHQEAECNGTEEILKQFALARQFYLEDEEYSCDQSTLSCSEPSTENKYKNTGISYKYVFIASKNIQNPLLTLEGLALKVQFPVQLYGKTAIYNSSLIFANKYKQNQNANEDNSIVDYSQLSLLLSSESIESMKVITAYTIEAFFSKYFPTFLGKDRYGLLLFSFGIDVTNLNGVSNQRVYLLSISQNPTIQPSGGIQQLRDSYSHLFEHFEKGFKKEIRFMRNSTLRIFFNSNFSQLYIQEQHPKTKQFSLPTAFKTLAPLDAFFRTKKVAVHDFPNFENFYQYFLKHQIDYYPSLRNETEYKRGQCDICFSKFIPKFRPHKNAVWGIQSGWKYTTKYEFSQKLEELSKKEKHPNFKIGQYQQETYYFDVFSPHFSSPQEQEFISKHNTNNGVWIFKPSSSYGGNGIKMVYNTSEIVKDIGKMKKTSSKKQNQTRTIKQDGYVLVQKYIENPFLINKKKFDMRMFPMVVSVEPLIAIYLDGYIRATLSDFELFSNDTSIHLTNLHAQQNHKDFKEKKKEVHLSIAQFEEYYYSAGFSKDKYENTLNHLRAASAFSIESILIDQQEPPGQFQLFGIDIMIDDQSNVKLIEMNGNPYMINGTNIHIKLIPKLLQAFLDISLEFQSQVEIYGTVINSDIIYEMCPHCDILIDETKGFYYLDYFNQTTGEFNYNNPVYKNKTRNQFTI